MKYDNATKLLRHIYYGDVYEVTEQVPKSQLEEELAELIYTWSVFESNPEKLRAAMLNQIKSMCKRIAESSDCESASDEDFESRWLEECDRYYDEKKDREAERG